MREGLISSNWTNNNSESINHVLKQTVNWERKNLSEFVVKNEKKVISTDGRSTIGAPQNGAKKPGQRKKKINVRTVTIDFKRAKTGKN